MKKIVGMALLLILLWSYPVLATTVYVDAVSEWQTFGNMMGNMKVTAYFGLNSQDAAWGNLGGGSWGASGTNWSLSVPASVDTFGGAWTLVNNGTEPMTGLSIDGFPGKTVFDTRFMGDVEGTLGSKRGWTFESVFDVSATYVNDVALTGQPPFGDLFQILQLSFDDNGLSGRMSFIADTDNVTIPSAAVPEPATMLLLGSGLIGLAGFARKRFKK